MYDSILPLSIAYRPVQNKPLGSVEASESQSPSKTEMIDPPGKFAGPDSDGPLWKVVQLLMQFFIYVSCTRWVPRNAFGRTFETRCHGEETSWMASQRGAEGQRNVPSEGSIGAVGTLGETAGTCHWCTTVLLILYFIIPDPCPQNIVRP